MQSFFVVFRKTLVMSGDVDRFFMALALVSSKNEIVRNYEIGLSIFLKSAGYTMGSYIKPIRFLFRFKALIRELNVQVSGKRTGNYVIYLIRVLRTLLKKLNKYIILNNVNPTHLYWYALLLESISFIKVDIFRILKDEQAAIYDALKRLNNYNLDYIREHQDRVCKYYDLQ